jgi:hypothetical protein
MSRILFASISAAFMLFWNTASFCANEQFGTADEAKALLERAVTALKANEADALRDFNNKNDKKFHHKDLYVFCFKISDGTFTAYQSDVMLGVDVRQLKMQEDPIGQRAYDAVAKAPEGDVVTIEYKFPKAGTKQMVLKQSIEERVGDQACGVTYFK